MSQPATEPRLAADRHDAVLALALGSLSLLRSAEEALRHPAPPGTESLASDDPLLLAALGFVSIGRSLRRWLEEAAQPPAAPDGHPADADPIPRELLR